MSEQNKPSLETIVARFAADNKPGMMETKGRLGKPQNYMGASCESHLDSSTHRITYDCVDVQGHHESLSAPAPTTSNVMHKPRARAHN